MTTSYAAIDKTCKVYIHFSLNFLSFFRAMPEEEEEFPPGEEPDEAEVRGEYGEYGGEEEIYGERTFERQIPTLKYPEQQGEVGAEEFEGQYGEHGEGGKFIVAFGEAEGEIEAPSIKTIGEEYEPSLSVPSIASSVSEIEETEEERAIRLLRESWLEKLKTKMVERQMLRRKNAFLQKKLVEHFKKRRMDHVLKEDSKGLDIDTKYLKRLYAFQDFRKNQEEQIAELSEHMKSFKRRTDSVEEELKDTLNKFVQRQRDLSMTLTLTKTGKKLNDKVVDRLLKRETNKNEELGSCRLKYIRIKYLIEDKENQLKAMESFGEGLHLMDYEQLKIDNQNFTDKIEEKDEELTKLRFKTHGNIQNLAHVREKAYAISGDIERMEEKFYVVETRFNETRERLTNAKRRRDALREEFLRLKMQSGLLTNNRLLRDFEDSIDEAEDVSKELYQTKRALAERKKRESELTSLAKRPLSSFVNVKLPLDLSHGKERSSKQKQTPRKKGVVLLEDKS